MAQNQTDNFEDEVEAEKSASEIESETEVGVNGSESELNSNINNSSRSSKSDQDISNLNLKMDSSEINNVSDQNLSTMAGLTVENSFCSDCEDKNNTGDSMSFLESRVDLDAAILLGSADLSDVIEYIQSGDLSFTRNTGNFNEELERWVGGPSSTSNEISMYTNGDPTNLVPPTCQIETSAGAVVKTPVILQTLAIPREKYRDDDFPDDPLLSMSKDSTAGDLSHSLYSHTHHTHTTGPPSDDSSPLGNRKKFTVVPMKSIDVEVDRKLSKKSGNQALGLLLSALYGKLLVVMGISFPLSEVISTFIPPSFYDGFYLYLYFGSITFMICILGNIVRQKATKSVRYTMRRIHTMRTRMTSTNSNGIAPDVTSNNDPPDSLDSEGSCSESPLPSRISPSIPRRKIDGSDSGVIHPDKYDSDMVGIQRFNYGSFYLRMGAVAFGIGSMIYSGLEFGQYFELEPDTKCHNVLIALTPAVRMIFTFMQMYFIFLNSKIAVSKVNLGAQFGLMHMIGTNMCVWLNVLVQETRHEILQFYNPDNHTVMTNHGIGHRAYGSHGHGHGHFGSPAIIKPTTTTTTIVPNLVHEVDSILNSTSEHHSASVVESLHRVKRGLKGPHSIYECRRTDIMGSLVQNASPFLFPCTIEYSLICAAILYVMWKSLAKSESSRNRAHRRGEISLYGAGSKRSPHHYSVDCARANKGLFLGIFVLVLTIISLILFFVLITRPGYQALATLEVNVCELFLYSVSTLAVLIGMCQVRELRYVRGRNLELDNILLIVAQTGSFIYNCFTIICGHFSMKKNTVLVLMTAMASLIQLLFQTLFILDASKRSAATADQVRRKPGREVITFLLVTNLAMWAINTLEKSRADSHPIQLKFYGVWAWTIITHISMPLAIFYRFHSTVCLVDIWKKSYKLKPSSSYH